MAGSGRRSDHVAAHMASQAGTGEVLVTEAAATSAGLDGDGLEHRHLSLKGSQADVVAVPVSSEAVDAGGSASR